MCNYYSALNQLVLDKGRTLSRIAKTVKPEEYLLLGESKSYQVSYQVMCLCQDLIITWSSPVELNPCEGRDLVYFAIIVFSGPWWVLKL